MADYINRDALIAEIERSWDWDSIDGITATAVLKQTISDIKNYPAVDVVDRVSLRDALYEADAITMRGVAIINKFSAAVVPGKEVGKWIEQKEWTGIEAFGFKEMVVGSFKCSACGFVVDVSEENFNFCPNCGAMMSHEDPSHPFADDVMMGDEL